MASSTPPQPRCEPVNHGVYGRWLAAAVALVAASCTYDPAAFHRQGGALPQTPRYQTGWATTQQPMVPQQPMVSPGTAQRVTTMPPAGYGGYAPNAGASPYPTPMPSATVAQPGQRFTPNGQPLTTVQPAPPQVAAPMATPSTPASSWQTAPYYSGPSAVVPQATTNVARHHVIQRGDTLSEISVRFGVSQASIMRANGLTSDRIIAGNTLVIPAQ